MNRQNIGNHPERISNIKPFIDQYNCKGIDFSAGIKDCKKFEQNNKTIALNNLYAPHNTKTINLADKSKYNRKRKNQVVLLMITNGEQTNEIDKEILSFEKQKVCHKLYQNVRDHCHYTGK